MGIGTSSSAYDQLCRTPNNLRHPSSPANLEFTLYRVANRNLPNDLGEPVCSQTATGVSSSFTFTWEGQTTTGEPAHNGNYELVVAAGGTSQSVSVQVNRQQGKQSWLNLGTQPWPPQRT